MGGGPAHLTCVRVALALRVRGGSDARILLTLINTSLARVKPRKEAQILVDSDKQGIPVTAVGRAALECDSHLWYLPGWGDNVTRLGPFCGSQTQRVSLQILGGRRAQTRWMQRSPRSCLEASTQSTQEPWRGRPETLSLD